MTRPSPATAALHEALDQLVVSVHEAGTELVALAFANAKAAAATLIDGHTGAQFVAVCDGVERLAEAVRLIEAEEASRG